MIIYFWQTKNKINFYGDKTLIIDLILTSDGLSSAVSQKLQNSTISSLVIGSAPVSDNNWIKWWMLNVPLVFLSKTLKRIIQGSYTSMS